MSASAAIVTPISASDLEAFQNVSGVQQEQDNIVTTTSSSSTSSTTTRQIPPFNPSTQELEEINTRFENASPQEILKFAIENIPNLYQTTAFGLTGLAAVDMISKISSSTNQKHAVSLIFLDTLYHFKETLDLAEAVRTKYGADLHIYRPPDVSNVAEFEEQYGKELWINDESSYDYLVKVEPARRAYAELNVAAVITGRRRSQGGERSSIPAIEIEQGTGLVKVNPLASWTFTQTKDYINQNNVPYNALLDQGYTSIGDWHSTKPKSDAKSGNSSLDADERAGRWSGRSEKTECGLHQDYFKMRMAFLKKQREKEQNARDSARDGIANDQVQS